MLKKLFPETPRGGDMNTYRVSYEVPDLNIASVEEVKAVSYADAAAQATSRIVWMYKVEDQDILIISILKL